MTQRDRYGRLSTAATQVSTTSSCNMRRASEVRDDLLDAQACIDWTTDREGGLLLTPGDYELASRASHPIRRWHVSRLA
jgi:hypothetical protein